MKVLSELSNAVLMRHITKEEESVCVGVCVRVHVGLVFLHRMMFPSMRACVRACVRGVRGFAISRVCGRYFRGLDSLANRRD